MDIPKNGTFCGTPCNIRENIKGVPLYLEENYVIHSPKEIAYPYDVILSFFYYI